MSTVEARNDAIRETSVDLELEAVVIPVADLERSKEFCARLGWRLDADFVFDNGFGVVQFRTSACQAGRRISSARSASGVERWTVSSTALRTRKRT